MRMVLLVGFLLASLAGAASGEPPAAAVEAWPRVIGEGVDPYARGHWPARVRSLETIRWTYSGGRETGMALPGSDGLVRTMAGGAGLRGLDSETGELLWTRGGNTRFWNYTSCVLGPDGTAYGGNHTWISAVAADGTLRWKSELQASWIHRPPALSPDGTTLYVGGDNLGIASIDAATGQVNWLRRERGSPSTLYCFDPEGRLVAGLRDRIVCFTKRGRELWEHKGHVSSLMAVGGMYIVSRGGTLEALQGDTRGSRWSLDLGAAIRGIALGDDGRIAVTLEGGAMAQVDLNGKLRWKRKISEVKLSRPATARGGETLVIDTLGVLRLLDSNGLVVHSIETGASFWRWRPSVGPDGRVYVNHHEKLLCIGGATRADPAPVVASSMTLVADDFVVDVWLNGHIVPLENRTRLDDIHGATSERLHLDVRPGDWLVFNVVANRLRWGGASYFGVHAEDDDETIAFVSTTRGGWACCDEPADVPALLAEREAGMDRPAVPPGRPWHDAGRLWQSYLGKPFSGEPVWGYRPNTWIKFVVPAREKE